ncbi:MAG: ABC transporter permease [Desulfurococcaceae archaeon]
MNITRDLNRKTGNKGKILQSMKAIFKEIWGMKPGKIALLLLLFLISLSVIALAVIPSDFIVKWESATYWEDNPVVAPPCWVNQLGYRVPATVQLYVDTPTDLIYENNVLTAEYVFHYNLDIDKLPQDMYLKVNAPLLCYSNSAREEIRISPKVRIFIERPDGISFEAWQVALRYTENTTCGDKLLYKTGKEGFFLATLLNELITKYNISVPLDIVGENKTYVTTANAILRTTIRSEVENRYLTILSMFIVPDTISITLRRIEQNSSLTTFLNSLLDVYSTLSSDGVNTFSREMVMKHLSNAINNLTSLIGNIGTATFSDFVDTSLSTRGSLEEAIKWSMDPDAKIPLEIRSKIQDVRDRISKYIETITSTTELLRPVITFKALEGEYKVTVKLEYSGIPVKPDHFNANVGFIVKGGCYGILGTAAKGVDIAAVILYGTPIALLIGLVAAVASVMIGVVAGIVSGYYGGIVDELIQRTVDILSNIPFLPLMIIIGSIAQKTFVGEMRSLYIILLYIVILIIFSWGGLAITVRAMTLSIKEEPYVEAAKALGATNSRIIFKHIFPQVMMYATAALVFRVPDAILTEAGLSVLGLRHGWPTWGSLLADARIEYRYDIWWWIIPPGLMLSLTSLTFVLLGLAIERIVEPRLRTL